MILSPPLIFDVDEIRDFCPCNGDAIYQDEGEMVYISMLSELEQGQFIVILGNMEDYVVLNNFPTSEKFMGLSCG